MKRGKGKNLGVLGNTIRFARKYCYLFVPFFVTAYLSAAKLRKDYLAYEYLPRCAIGHIAHGNFNSGLECLRATMDKTQESPLELILSSVNCENLSCMTAADFRRFCEPKASDVNLDHHVFHKSVDSDFVTNALRLTSSDGVDFLACADAAGHLHVFNEDAYIKTALPSNLLKRLWPVRGTQDRVGAAATEDGFVYQFVIEAVPGDPVQSRRYNVVARGVFDAGDAISLLSGADINSDGVDELFMTTAHGRTYGIDTLGRVLFDSGQFFEKAMRNLHAPVVANVYPDVPGPQVLACVGKQLVRVYSSGGKELYNYDMDSKVDGPLLVGDVDGDSLPDVIILADSNALVHSTGGYHRVSIPGGTRSGGWQLADVDQDGRDDLVHTHGHTLRVFFGHPRDPFLRGLMHEPDANLSDGILIARHYGKPGADIFCAGRDGSFVIYNTSSRECLRVRTQKPLVPEGMGMHRLNGRNYLSVVDRRNLYLIGDGWFL